MVHRFWMYAWTMSLVHSTLPDTLAKLNIILSDDFRRVVLSWTITGFSESVRPFATNLALCSSLPLLKFFRARTNRLDRVIQSSSSVGKLDSFKHLCAISSWSSFQVACLKFFECALELDNSNISVMKTPGIKPCVYFGIPGSSLFRSLSWLDSLDAIP